MQYIIANFTQKTLEFIQKLGSCRQGDIIISTNTSTMNPETSTYMVPSDVLRKLRADFVYNNGIYTLSNNIKNIHNYKSLTHRSL